MQNYSVKFGGNDISTIPGVSIYNYNATDLPQRDVLIHKIARRSLSIITSSEYTQKNIYIMMRVCSGTRQDSEATITDIKGNLQLQNQDLEVTQSGGQYKYTATMNEFVIEWDGAIAWATVGFIASTPIASSANSSSLFSFNTLLPSDSASFLVDGSYDAEPLINLLINSVTGGTGSISIFNSSTNQGITISGTFTAGDSIEIDSKNYIVTHNGSNIDFEGIFPTFPAGSQRVGYTDTFSSRNVDVNGTYNVNIV